MDDTLRTCFDQDAGLYDQARPGFPSALLDDLVDRCGIRAGCALLEIGPGTGQATLELAGRGAHVHAVELGPALADNLRTKVGKLPVEVDTAGFEQWPLPTLPFDVVASFRAWHWIDAEVRTSKVASALRPGGVLATVTETHVAGGTPGFHEGVRDCFAAASPGAPMEPPPDAETVVEDLDEVDGSDLFTDVVRSRYVDVVSYAAQEYVDLLGTYPWRLLPAPIRDDFFGRVRALIDDEFGGTIAKAYLYELRTARRI